jgi:hypothetical protein
MESGTIESSCRDEPALLKKEVALTFENNDFNLKLKCVRLNLIKKRATLERNQEWKWKCCCRSGGLTTH